MTFPILDCIFLYISNNPHEALYTQRLRGIYTALGRFLADAFSSA
jgi:hypothetical protein